MNRRSFLSAASAALSCLPLVGGLFRSEPKTVEYRVHDKPLCTIEMPKRVRCLGGPLDGQEFDLPHGIRGQYFCRKYWASYDTEPVMACYAWGPLLANGTMAVVYGGDA